MAACKGFSALQFLEGAREAYSLLRRTCHWKDNFGTGKMFFAHMLLPQFSKFTDTALWMGVSLICRGCAGDVQVYGSSLLGSVTQYTRSKHGAREEGGVCCVTCLRFCNNFYTIPSNSCTIPANTWCRGSGYMYIPFKNTSLLLIHTISELCCL